MNGVAKKIKELTREPLSALNECERRLLLIAAIIITGVITIRLPKGTVPMRANGLASN